MDVQDFDIYNRLGFVYINQTMSEPVVDKNSAKVHLNISRF